jgi:hypothetical protein
MYPRTHLLGIPAEIRLQIYRDYVTTPGGYFYDVLSGKLTDSGGHRISLTLALTCKLIADEFTGLPFKMNTVTFSTSYSDETRQTAGLYSSVIETVRRAKTMGMLQLLQNVMTADVRQDVSIKHPELMLVLDRLVELMNCDMDQWPGMYNEPMYTLWDRAVDLGYTFGEVPSTFRSLATRLCQLAAATRTPLTEYQFHGGYRMIQDYLNRKHNKTGDPLPSEFDRFARWPVFDNPWTIPDAEDIRTMAEKLNMTAIVNSEPDSNQVRYYVLAERVLGVPPCHCFKIRDRWTKWRFSAAATCIRFLNSLSAASRMALHKIVLLEDHESVAYPESHVEGLIPFCQANPLLRVERRVDLWRTVFPLGSVHTHIRGTCQVPFQRARRENGELRAHTISHSLGPWIVEAHALAAKGMPSGSFRLVLDGDPVPAHTSTVFSALLRDVAYQRALHTAHARGWIRDPILYTHKHNNHLHFTALPSAVDGIVRGTNAVVSCNFEIEHVVEDEEYYLEQGKGWSEEKWDQSWDFGAQRPSGFPTVAPLPPWRELMQEEHPCGVPEHMTWRFN